MNMSVHPPKTRPARDFAVRAAARLMLSLCALSALAVPVGQARAQAASPASDAVASGSPPDAAGAAASKASNPVRKAAPARAWAKVPRVFGRLTARDVGLVINTDDPYSVRVGEHYAKARGLADDQILRVAVPIKGSLTRDEFEDLAQRVDRFFGDRVQALALAWRQPYGVDCNSITGALTLGFDPGACSNTCAPTRPSRYFGSPSTRPYADYKMRLSMLLAASNSNEAIALIDRGVQADGSQGLRGAPRSHVHFVTTSDAVRSVRQVFFPPAGPIQGLNLDVHLDQTDALKDASGVLMYITGRAQVDHLDTVRFVPGAVADHLTSFGGLLDKPHGQMTVLSWINAGATASYGTTSEPCSHWQKFPHPQALLLFYAQGASVIEAYWKSVLWPQQGLFVGEPLAAPFDRTGAATRQVLRR